MLTTVALAAHVSVPSDGPFVDALNAFSMTTLRVWVIAPLEI